MGSTILWEAFTQLINHLLVAVWEKIQMMHQEPATTKHGSDFRVLDIYIYIYTYWESFSEDAIPTRVWNLCNANLYARLNVLIDEYYRLKIYWCNYIVNLSFATAYSKLAIGNWGFTCMDISPHEICSSENSASENIYSIFFFARSSLWQHRN